MLKIPRDINQKLMEHAQKEAPLEACGYLAEKDGEVVCHYELTNTDKSGEHFTMDPKEQFETVRDIREHNYKTSAVYHSHPETPARPSEEDIKLAYDAEISYVIISLLTREIKSFKIKNGEVSPEEIVLID
ncbi:MAG: M67 family metallopeptidase [Fibrobacteria bacterium]|nr:M67 family metallopeptidase [Fibrobacteria bacterium]